jgi:threonine/homoserine/homoserine lactone efflux protein
MAQGRRAGILSAAGISMGLLFHTSFAALGLSAILRSSEQAFSVVKYAGAAYLVYIGIQSIVSKRGTLSVEVGERRATDGMLVFKQGVMTNILNPKAIITFMAIIPQFVRPERGDATFQIVLLGCTLSLLAVLWFSLVGYFSGVIGSFLSTRPWFRQAMQRLMGTVLIGLGVRLALQRRT